MAAKEYGIRPYVDEEQEDKSFIEKMRRPTWAQQLGGVQEEKHSEMVKPYKFDDYQEMEHYYPEPLFFSEWPDSIPPQTDVLIRDRSGSPAHPCLISALGNGGNRRNCDAPLRARWVTVSYSSARLDPGRWAVYSMNRDTGKYSRISVRVSIKPGGVFPVEILPSKAYTNWSSYPDFDSTFENIFLKIYYKDPAGSICSTTERMYCSAACACPSGNFAFDDASTPDTIAPGGSISIYVSGGCPPYSWSTSDTGYSLGNASTTGVSNTLDCAAGTCGVNYDPTVTVTVTDACSDSVQFTLRNTGGQWTQVNSEACGSVGAAYTGNVIDEDVRYRMTFQDFFQANTYGASCPKAAYDSNNHCYPNNPCGVLLHTNPTYWAAIATSAGLANVPPCCYRSLSNDCRWIENGGVCGVASLQYTLDHLYTDNWTC